MFPKWRYAEMGVPPNHPFIDGIFQYKLSSCWGTSIYGNPMSFQNHRYNLVIPTALPDFKSFLKICMAPGQRKTPGWLLVSGCEECCFTKQHGQPTKQRGFYQARCSITVMNKRRWLCVCFKCSWVSDGQGLREGRYWSMSSWTTKILTT